jgi:hypothetical protein
MKNVVSDAVAQWDYDLEIRNLYIRFHSSPRIYTYYDIDPELADYFNYPHPWRKVGHEVKAHDWD